MDFIAIDLDQAWKAFQYPKPIYVESYVPPETQTSPFLKLAQFCEVTPTYGCIAKDDQEPPSQPSTTFTFGGTSWGGNVNPSGIGEGAQTDPTDAPDDPNINGTGEDEETQGCQMEQTSEANIDAAAQAAADEINSKEPEFEHATFGVRDGNSIVTLTVSTGDSGTADVVSLYTALSANGYDMSDVVFFIHSHPSSTITDASWAAAEDFANQFPSDNDLGAYADFLEDAVEDGANEATWLSNFTAYIVGPDNVNREYGNFTLDSSGDSVTSPDVEEINVHPEPGSDEYQQIQETADSAETDAANGCG